MSAAAERRPTQNIMQILARSVEEQLTGRHPSNCRPKIRMRLLSGLVSATSTWCSLGRKRCLTTRVGGPVAATTAELQQWFEAGGGLIHRNVVLATKQTQPEVRTIGAVAKGEQLMSCPLTLALGFESPWDDKSAEEQLQRLASACVPQDMWQLHLGLRLLRERIQGESSKWHKYISALPLLYTGVPLFFKKKGFESIIYPPLATQVSTWKGHN